MIHLICFFLIFRQEEQLRKELSELLNSVIVQDETLSSGFASNQTWSDRPGLSASLTVIAAKLESTKSAVSVYTFIILEMGEFDEVVLSSF